MTSSHGPLLLPPDPISEGHWKPPWEARPRGKSMVSEATKSVHGHGPRLHPLTQSRKVTRSPVGGASSRRLAEPWDEVNSGAGALD